jgi:hypothetical protein
MYIDHGYTWYIHVYTWYYGISFDVYTWYIRCISMDIPSFLFPDFSAGLCCWSHSMRTRVLVIKIGLAYTMYIKSIETVYTSNFNWIYIVYDMNITCIFRVYSSHGNLNTPIRNKEILLAGQGCRTLLAPQTVSCKRLDEILRLYAASHRYCGWQHQPF